MAFPSAFISEEWLASNAKLLKAKFAVLRQRPVEKTAAEATPAGAPAGVAEAAPADAEDSDATIPADSDALQAVGQPGAEPHIHDLATSGNQEQPVIVLANIDEDIDAQRDRDYRQHGRVVADATAIDRAMEAPRPEKRNFTTAFFANSEGAPPSQLPRLSCKAGDKRKESVLREPAGAAPPLAGDDRWLDRARLRSSRGSGSRQVPPPPPAPAFPAAKAKPPQVRLLPAEQQWVMANAPKDAAGLTDASLKAARALLKKGHELLKIRAKVINPETLRNPMRLCELQWEPWPSFYS